MRAREVRECRAAPLPASNRGRSRQAFATAARPRRALPCNSFSPLDLPKARERSLPSLRADCYPEIETYMDCVFCKISAGSIPSTKVYEDDLVFAIRDIRPQAPVHVLVIPRVHVESLSQLSDEKLAGRLMFVASEIARGQKLADGWRLIANSGEHGGQEVMHLHLHVLGGRALGRMLPSAR